jgi:hypothetical protein
MMRIKMHYEMRMQAADHLKKLVIGCEPQNLFQHDLAEALISQSNFNTRTLKDTRYCNSPDEHDDAVAIVMWDIHCLPREHALSRLEIKEISM